MKFQTFDLGLVSFADALEFQRDTFLKVKAGILESGLIICRHQPVITLGRQADKKNILLAPNELRQKKIEIFDIDRGGDVTYHGPGQITAYPIFNLNYFKKDVHLFLRRLEEVAISFLSDFRINGARRNRLTGVWIGTKKIASMGIAIRNWITFHGLTINIKADDLENFGLIRPCGMDIRMTSLETVLGRNLNIDDLKPDIIRQFKSIYDIKMITTMDEERGAKDDFFVHHPSSFVSRNLNGGYA